MDVNQLQKVEDSSTQVTEMANLILGDALKNLDEYLEKVKAAFVINQEILDQDLNKIILEIPVYVYNVIVYAQQLEMKKGLSKEHAKYAQNEAMLRVQGTVADKTAKAENETVQDRITMAAYNMASSIVSKKIEGALTILDSARKVQQARSKEKFLTASAGNAVGSF